MFTVNKGNRKLGANILAINLPAGITCKCDAPCNTSNKCYAKKGAFQFPSVKNCYINNLKAFIDDPAQAEKDILSQLPSIGYVRVHASGDFVNEEYLCMLIRIAGLLPNVYFMAYTKKYALINNYIDKYGYFPNNFTVIYSKWDEYPMYNPYNMPVAYVRLKKGNKEPISQNAIQCEGNCSKCYKCWNLKLYSSVVFDEH